jgi:hypothetical protein
MKIGEVSPFFGLSSCKRKYRISNMECRMLKLYDRGKNFIIHNSMFDIRYSFREQDKFIILELPTAEELAKHLPESDAMACFQDDC